MLLRIRLFCDTITGVSLYSSNNNIDKISLAFIRDEVGEIFFIVHEEVLCEYSWTERMTEDIEVFFPVRIPVSCVVGADYLVLEDLLRSFIEAVSKPV